jgi:hypothetical protein
VTGARSNNPQDQPNRPDAVTAKKLLKGAVKKSSRRSTVQIAGEFARI